MFAQLIALPASFIQELNLETEIKLINQISKDASNLDVFMMNYTLSHSNHQDVEDLIVKLTASLASLKDFIAMHQYLARELLESGVIEKHVKERIIQQVELVLSARLNFYILGVQDSSLIYKDSDWNHVISEIANDVTNNVQSEKSIENADQSLDIETERWNSISDKMNSSLSV